MSAPDDSLPPSYDEISNSTPATIPQPSPPQPELVWYRQQGCVLNKHPAADLEIIINDRTGHDCIGSPERLSGLFNEQVAKPPGTQIRIVGSHFGAGKKTVGKIIDFDLWIVADWLIAPGSSSCVPLPRTTVVCRGNHERDMPVDVWAEWIHQDYGRTKAVLIESHVFIQISDNLRKQIIESIRATKYGGHIDISIHVNQHKTFILRQEITSRTTTRFDRTCWPTSFSILRPRWNDQKLMEQLKQEMKDDMCIIKARWSHGDTKTVMHTGGSGSAFKLHKSSHQSPYPDTTSREDAWFSSWRVPLQNAVIEMHEDSRHGTRKLTSRDLNDADVIGLRRTSPEKSWGGLLPTVSGPKVFCQ